MPSKQPPPLVRTKGLPKDASVSLPDDIIKKWQAEKVEDPCNIIECPTGLTTVLNVHRRCFRVNRTPRRSASATSSSLRGVLGIANPHSSTDPDARAVRGSQTAQNSGRSSVYGQKALR